jgi:hypothetical protein
MLNWRVVMRLFGLLISAIFFILFLATPASAQDLSTRKAEIASQAAGEAVRGIVPIKGNTLVEGFISWEVTFGYAEDTTGTWFLIDESDEPVEDGLLTNWDTTTITDGIYNLRLTTYLEEGRRTHFTVYDIRVRNYTAIETTTPTPTLTSTPFTETPKPSQTPTITLLPTETPIPDTPTPLPTNPVEISTTDVSFSLMSGVAGVLAAFLIIGMYATIRKWLRKS